MARAVAVACHARFGGGNAVDDGLGNVGRHGLRPNHLFAAN
jgi:hypothetical protein